VFAPIVFQASSLLEVFCCYRFKPFCVAQNLENFDSWTLEFWPNKLVFIIQL